MMHKRLIRIVGWLAACHVSLLLVLTLCRLVHCWCNMPPEGVQIENVIKALAIGVKFDNLIASYIVALPLVLLSVLALAPVKQAAMNFALKCSRWYLWLLYSIVIIVSIADIRYYQFFDNHLNWQVSEWFGFVGDTAGMLFGDVGNWVVLLSVVVISAGMWLIIRWLSKVINTERAVADDYSAKTIIPSAIAAILLWGLCFVGMRGSLQRYPLNISFAYFCDDTFCNRLGINPLFNIIKTAEYKGDEMPKILQGVDAAEAISYVQQQLGVDKADSANPIARKYESLSTRCTISKPNVVLILMESMMSANLEREYNGQPLTPYLKSLTTKSIYFSNAYSAGIHTNNGIVASQYGYLPNFAHTSMPLPSDDLGGMPSALKHEGYNTVAFLTSNPNYDNMNSFLRDNAIDKIYSLYDYPQDKVVNNFGVADDYLFSFGVERLNEYAADTVPFYAMFLTVSNHIPYIVPDKYKNRGATPEEQIIAYSDDAVCGFMQQAQATDWGKNTIFVLVADHGHIAPQAPQYDMQLSFNKIPIFIVADWLEEEQIDNVASQIDIYPTVLRLLDIEFENRCLGIDLLREQRRYAFFVNNEYLGCADGEYLWCESINTGKESLYKIGSAENVIMQYDDLASDMRQYAHSMMYVNLYCRFNKLVGCSNSMSINAQ